MSNAPTWKVAVIGAAASQPLHEIVVVPPGVYVRVDDGRIVDADAPGIDTDLRGLTLLEACAVGGETLPVDALANALGPAVCAAPDPERVEPIRHRDPHAGADHGGLIA